MARIRSIKPEFATDGKIRRLSDTSALFFILLWNHCDDWGYFTTDTLELSMKLARWRSQDIKRVLTALHRQGLVTLSAGHGVGKVVGWDHQKIKDRRASKWKDIEIKWDDSPIDAPGSDKKPPWIGEDRIGEDRIYVPATATLVAGPDENLPAVQTKNPSKLKPETLTGETWESYADAYSHRYGVQPVRNVTVNSQLANFVKRLGKKDAPWVAAFYVGHNNRYYLQQGHSVGAMVKDAEKLRTEWVTGRKITTGQAGHAEKKQANMDVFQQLISEERSKT